MLSMLDLFRLAAGGFFDCLRACVEGVLVSRVPGDCFNVA